MSNDTSDWIPITIKYRGRCVNCGMEMTSGLALWSKSAKAIRHLDCSAKNPDKQASDVQFASRRYSQPMLLKCFICGKEKYQEDENDSATPYGNKQRILNSFICQSCLEKDDAFEAYRQTFLRKLKRYTK